jgi:septation ring formation regulator EzrA
MPKLMPSPIADIQKPLERMEEALVEVRTEVERLSKVENEIAAGFEATCERLDRVVALLEAEAAARLAVKPAAKATAVRKGRAAA